MWEISHTFDKSTAMCFAIAENESLFEMFISCSENKNVFSTTVSAAVKRCLMSNF